MTNKTAIELLREIYDDVVQGAIPNKDDPWFENTRAALATPAQVAALVTPSDADIIALADKTRTGVPGRDGYILPISFARAVLAKWGSPAPASQPVTAPVGMEPVYQIGQPFPFDPENTWRDASKDVYDMCMPSKRRIIYTAAQVQAMLAAVPRNAPLYSPDDVAPEPASIAAVEVAAPIAPAREPLTDEQIDEIHLANSDAYERGDVEYESHGFARAIEHHHGITATQKGRPGC